MPIVSSGSGLSERPSAWLQAAQEGDQNALEQLVENQRAELLSIAVSQLDSDLRVKEAPSDLVQLSMLEGIRSFGQFRGRTIREFAGYLRSILLNNLQDARRRFRTSGKRDLSREVPCDDPNHFLDRQGGTPSGRLQHQDDSDRMLRALDSLPKSHQQLLRLRYWEQLTFEQIAEKLGQQSDATRKAFYRALSALTEAINR